MKYFNKVAGRYAIPGFELGGVFDAMRGGEYTPIQDVPRNFVLNPENFSTPKPMVSNTRKLGRTVGKMYQNFKNKLLPLTAEKAKIRENVVSQSASQSKVSGGKIPVSNLPVVLPKRDFRTGRVKPPIQDVSYTEVSNEPIITPPPKKVAQLPEGRMSQKQRTLTNELKSSGKPIILGDTPVLNANPKWFRPSLIGTGAAGGGAIGALGGSLFNKKDSSTGTVVGGLAGATLGGGATAWHSSGQNNKLMGKALELFKKFKKV